MLSLKTITIAVILLSFGIILIINLTKFSFVYTDITGLIKVIDQE